MLSNDDACLITSMMRLLFPPQMRSRIEDQASDVRAFLYRHIHMHPLNEKYGTLIIGTQVGINQAAGGGGVGA